MQMNFLSRFLGITYLQRGNTTRAEEFVRAEQIQNKHVDDRCIMMRTTVTGQLCILDLILRFNETGRAMRPTHSRVCGACVPDVIRVDIDVVDTQVQVGSGDGTNAPLSLAAKGGLQAGDQWHGMGLRTRKASAVSVISDQTTCLSPTTKAGTIRVARMLMPQVTVKNRKHETRMQDD
jgi:hypothetical protein